MLPFGSPFVSIDRWCNVVREALRMNRVRRFVTVITMIVVGLGLASLAPGETPSAASSRLKVAATIFPLYDLVRQIASPLDVVVLLVPPGASPHTFAARPHTIRALADSTAIFAIGHGVDNWATRLAREVGIARAIVVDEQIALRPWNTSYGHGRRRSLADRHGMTDPHYWLAIPNAMRMVHHIAASLGHLNPAGRQGYHQRAAAYGEQLQVVHQDIRQLLVDLPQRNMATFHPAFSYFAEAYDLHIVATFESSPGREPAPRQVERFLRLIRAHNLHVLFVEPQLPQRLLSSLADDLGITLKGLDPLGGSQGRDSYIAMMRFNANQIATALRE